MPRNTFLDLTRFSYAIALPPGGASNAAPPVGALDIAPLNGRFLIAVNAPAFTAGQLPNGETLTWTLVEADDPGLTVVRTATTMGVQTGAGGVGAAAATFAARMAMAGGTYCGVKVTASAAAAVNGVTVNQYLAAW